MLSQSSTKEGQTLIKNSRWSQYLC